MDFSQKLLTLEDNLPFDATACDRDIFNCFRLVLNRYPGRAEWESHQIHLGRPLASVTAGYLGSVEYQNLSNANNGPVLVQMPGFVMYVSPGDLDIGIHILEHQEWESHVSRVFAAHLRPGMTVLDIGANIGYFTFLAASRVGSSGRVWAIEPNRRNVSFLLATRARNEFGHVEIIQAAASDRWEVLTLSLGCASSNSTALRTHGTEPVHFAEPVMALPLTACLPDSQRVDMIKIDVEGAEGKALGGMLDILDRDRPIVFSEFTPSTLPAISRISPGEYLSIFKKRGYSLAVLEKSGPRSLSVEALLEHAAAVAVDSHLDILAEPAQRPGS
jgi:FkbM family methyltransferase